jgi:hypothetical protein
MTDDSYEYDSDIDPNNTPGRGGPGATAPATERTAAGDGLPGFPVEGLRDVRAGVFGAGKGLLGMMSAAEALPDAAPAPPGGSVDWDFIHQREAAGGPSLSMYVPEDGQRHVLGRSGPTIAYGFDVGQRSPRDLQRLGLSQPVMDALIPYARRTGTAAQTYVKAHPLTLAQSDVDAIDQAVRNRMASDLAAKFDAASQVGPFSGLPSHTQTAIADLYHQYGWSDPARAAPNLWRQVTSGDWQGAYDNLQDFHDIFPSRRKDEATLLKQDMDAGILPIRRGRSGS